eukprot:s1733_g15.t3
MGCSDYAQLCLGEDIAEAAEREVGKFCGSEPHRLGLCLGWQRDPGEGLATTARCPRRCRKEQDIAVASLGDLSYAHKRHFVPKPTQPRLLLDCGERCRARPLQGKLWRLVLVIVTIACGKDQGHIRSRAAMASRDSCRLHIHARLYHRRKTDKPAAISTYWEKADYCDQSDLRRLAAPVASWIAYGPQGRIPRVEEFQLLTKFLDKMDGGLLPSRLRAVLSEMLTVLQSFARPDDEAWNKAEKRLQKSYRKLRRRSTESETGAGVVAMDDDIVEAELRAEDVALQIPEAEDSGTPWPCTSDQPQSDQHLILFRKMNEWGFLDNAQKLERLQQAEEASRRSRSLGQAELADVLSTAAACLAAPRRHARLHDAHVKDLGEVSTAPESQDPTVDLQKRVRSLFLHALRMWQTSHFDCQAIEHVLDCVQQKISKFESKVGEIQGAAAGKAWLKIKKMVDELLLRVEAPSISHANGARKAQTKAAQKAKTRLERQSGIQNITWVVKHASWKCQRSYGKGAIRRQKARFFPISKFLGQGLGEEAAVEAALKEAKAYREELVRQGKLKPPKPRPPRSTVRGVSFHKGHQKWQVRLYHAVEKKTVCCGSFDGKEDAEVKARKMATQLGVRPEYEGLVSPQISASAASMDLERLAQVEARPGGLLAALRERGTLPSFGGMTSVASPPRLDLSPAPITRPAEEVPPEALKSRPTPQRTQKPTAAKSKPKLGASKDGFEPSASEARPGLRKAKRPPVPAFALKPPEPEPWQLLRQIQLSDKKEEENYEISEKGSNSEAEEEPDRSHKRTPDWSLKFLELLETQADIDADTIFGSRVPRCDLEEIFTDRDYLRYAADRPVRRRRGSSGEWRRDRLSRAEICMALADASTRSRPGSTAGGSRVASRSISQLRYSLCGKAAEPDCRAMQELWSPGFDDTKTKKSDTVATGMTETLSNTERELACIGIGTVSE